MTTKLKMIALYDCITDNEEELSFKEGDIFVEISQTNRKDWYQGRIENTSQRGHFPGKFVRPLQGLFHAEPDKKPESTNGVLSDDAFSAALSNSSLKKECKSTKIVASETKQENVPNNKPILAPVINPKLISKATDHRIDIKFSTPPPVFERKNSELSQDDFPTRSRSYSASSVKNATDNNLGRILRPSQLTNEGKSELKMAFSNKVPSKLSRHDCSPKYVPIGSGIQLVGLTPSVTQEEEEEEDGFQLIKPSQIRLQKLQTTSFITPKAAMSTPASSFLTFKEKTSTDSWKKLPNKSSSTINLENVPASSNPMPKLPSRPTPKTNRKKRSSKSSPLNSKSFSSISTTSNSLKEQENIPDKVSLPPILKPKPNISQPSLPPRPKKLRSASNPPLIQPKPTLSSAESSSSPSTTNSKVSIPPRIGMKPSIYQQNLQSANKIISPPMSPGKYSPKIEVSTDANLRPSMLLNRARSATNPSYLGSKPNIESITHNSPKKNSTVKKTPSSTIEIESEPKKKIAPPPPPSRPSKNEGKFIDSGARKRYENLFDTIHDDGYVDGKTVRIIWMKSKLSKEELARLWKECDPDHKGLLDKNAFILGMGKIDVILKKNINVS